MESNASSYYVLAEDKVKYIVVDKVKYIVVCLRGPVTTI